MELEQHVASFRRELAALTAAAGAAALDAPVPTCPEWDVADLLTHTAQVHNWARMNVERGDPAARARFRELPAAPEQDRLLEWFSSGGARLAATLESAPADRAVWTFAPPREARFWARRVHHETAIHRLDAELAAGREPTPFGIDAALDGVDEVLVNMAHRPSGAIPRGAGETLHFHATDAPARGEDGGWVVQLTSDGPSVTREHAKGDAAVRGAASGLFLFLWGRDPRVGLEVFGDQELLARFRAEATV